MGPIAYPRTIIINYTIILGGLWLQKLIIVNVIVIVGSCFVNDYLFLNELGIENLFRIGYRNDSMQLIVYRATRHSNPIFGHNFDLPALNV